MTTKDTECPQCREAIEWRTDFDRPYPANKDGSLHRCAVAKANVDEMLNLTQATYQDIEAEAASRYDISPEEFVGDEYDSAEIARKSGFIEGAKWERERAK